jgi:hypothetical protein
MKKYLILAAMAALGLASALAQTNNIQLRNGANSTMLVASTGGSCTLTLPASAGTNGQVLTTDGSGILSWSSSSTSIDGLSDAISNANVVALGSQAGASLTTGSGYSVLVGIQAGRDLASSTNVVAVGYGALRVATGGDNVSVGTESLNALTTGTNNVAIGTYAGSANVITGSGNVFIGDRVYPTSNVSNKLYIDNQAGDSPLIYGDFSGNTLTFNGSVTTTGTSALNGNVTVGGGASASELRMLEASGDGSNYTAFKAQAQAANVTYTLPAADGTSGYLHKTNGSGTLAWTNSLVAGTTLTAESATGGGQLNIDDPGGNITWVIDQEQAGPGREDRFRIWYYDGTVNETRGIQIEEGGDVGIGIANPAYKLDVVGDINASANVRAAGTALTSDARLKRNIQPLTNALDVVQQLRPVSYEKRADLQSNDYSMKQMGFIAQELESVLPNSVQTDKSADAIKSVDYISIIPVLTKALQEQQQTINKQQAEIDELRQLIKRMSVR